MSYSDDVQELNGWASVRTNPSTASWSECGPQWRALVANIIAHAQCSHQSLIFLGRATQPVNILEYRSPLGVDGGVATAELLLPKRIFSVSLKEGFQSEQLCSCKAYHTNGKQYFLVVAKRGSS